MLGFIILGVVALIVIVLLFSSFVFVREQHFKIIERLGVYTRTAKPGLSMKIPFIDQVVHHNNVLIFERQSKIETRTADKAIVTLTVAVQMHINEKKPRIWLYTSNDPAEKIDSFITDIVRTEIPKLTLDEVFETKDTIANTVLDLLADLAAQLGATITSVLLLDIDPGAGVAEAMNRINIAERTKVAAEAEGEADKILAIKAAEAEAESKRLQGEGTAKQRIAIAKGLKEAVDIQKEAGLSADEGMQLVILTQYFDTLRDVGADGKNTTIMIPLSSNPTELFGELVKASTVAKELR